MPWVSLGLAGRCSATLPSPSPSGFRRASPPLAIGTAWRREALGPGLRESGTRRGEAGATEERVSILRSYKTTNNTPRPRSVHSGEGAYRTTHTRARTLRSHRSRALYRAVPTRLSLSPTLTPASGHYNPLLSEDTLSHKSPGAGGRVACSTGSTYLAYFEVLVSQIFNRRYGHRMQLGK